LSCRGRAGRGGAGGAVVAAARGGGDQGERRHERSQCAHQDIMAPTLCHSSMIGAGRLPRQGSAPREGGFADGWRGSFRC
jgi:hypothetical protein